MAHYDNTRCHHELSYSTMRMSTPVCKLLMNSDFINPSDFATHD